MRAVIKGKRVTLRKPKIKDAADIAKYCKEKDLSKWVTGMPHPYTKKHAIKFIKDCSKKWKTGSYNLVIEKRGELVGMISISKKNFDKAEIGWWVGKPHWGKGCAPEAAKLLIKEGFKKLKLNKIYAHFKEGNKKSERVMQKTGMKYECLLKEDIKQNGKYYNLRQYCILKRW